MGGVAIYAALHVEPEVDHLQAIAARVPAPWAGSGGKRLSTSIAAPRNSENIAHVSCTGQRQTATQASTRAAQQRPGRPAGAGCAFI